MNRPLTDQVVPETDLDGKVCMDPDPKDIVPIAVISDLRVKSNLYSTHTLYHK